MVLKTPGQKTKKKPAGASEDFLAAAEAPVSEEKSTMSVFRTLLSEVQERDSRDITDEEIIKLLSQNTPYQKHIRWFTRISEGENKGQEVEWEKPTDAAQTERQHPAEVAKVPPGRLRNPSAVQPSTKVNHPWSKSWQNKQQAWKSNLGSNYQPAKPAYKPPRG